MTHRIVIAALVGMLALGAGIAVFGLRSGEGSGPSGDRPPVSVPAAEAPSSPPPAASPAPVPAPANPAASSALKLQRLLSASPGAAVGEEEALPSSEAQKAAWLEREALRDALRKDPASWADVIDLLAAGDFLATSLKVVVLARAAVDEPAEQVLLSLMRTRHHPYLRQLVLAALDRRDSRATFAACSTAVVEDENAGVRLAGLYGLAGIRDRASTPELRSAADDLIRRRSREEQNPEVRIPALRLSGEAVPMEARSSPPARPPRRPFDVSR
jgi:hypothetical protein